jgi:hypothetical protein
VKVHVAWFLVVSVKMFRLTSYVVRVVHLRSELGANLPELVSRFTLPLISLEWSTKFVCVKVGLR